MSSSESQVSFVLAEPLAELKVVDAQFRVVRRGVGSLTHGLAKGVYKLLASAAGETVERLFVVDGSGTPQRVEVPPIRFRSAAPLDGTSTAHDGQRRALVAASRAEPEDVGLGRGSALLFGLRDLGRAHGRSRRDDPSARALARRSFEGFSLESPSGALHTLEGAASADEDEGCLALHVALAPGYYTLRYARAGGLPVAMPLYVSARYAAQLFLAVDLSDDQSRPGVPDLRDRVLALAPADKTFDPADPALRALEVARRAYAQRRYALAAPLLQAYLATHGSNPLLGVFALHLALQSPLDRSTGDHATLRTCVDELMGQLGTDFPDAVILDALVRGVASEECVVSSPPLLRLNWQALLEHRIAASPALSSVLSRASNADTWLAWRPVRPTRSVDPIRASEAPGAARAARTRGGGAVEKSMLESAPRAGLTGSPTLAPRDWTSALDQLARLASSAWWDEAVAGLRALGPDDDLPADLTSLQATLLAALELERTVGGRSFTRADLEALAIRLGVPQGVLGQSAAELGAVLMHAFRQRGGSPR